MKEILIVIALSCTGLLNAQPGIYNESDIDYQSLFIDAQIAKYLGDTDKEIELLKTIITRDKNSHAAYYELGRTYLTTGNLELAEKNAKKAYALSTQNEWYILLLVDIYEKAKNHGQASVKLKELITLKPKDPSTYHRLAVQQLSENNIGDAILTLKQLQEQTGIEEETSRRLFDIYVQTGNEKEAVSTLLSLIKAFPNNTRFRHNLASYYLEIDKTKDAQAMYQEILTIDPYDSKASLALVRKDVPTSDAAQYLISLGSVMENLNLPLDNKIQELMPYLSNMVVGSPEATELDKLSKRLTEIYPEEAKVYALRADVMFYNQDFEGSVVNYKKAIEMDDRKYALWSQYMINLWELEKFDLLINVSEEAIDLYPNNVNAFLMHAIALGKSNNPNAKKFAREAEFISGNRELLINQIQIVNLWLENAKANEAFNAIEFNDINDPILIELAGEIYLSSGEKEKAKMLWQAAIDLGANPSRINSKTPIK